MGHLRDDATVARGLELSARGAPDREVAEICGVAIKTVRRWRREYVRLGRQRFGARGALRCPRCSDQLDGAAYAYVLGLYLGDGHLALARRGVLRLDISCADAWPGLIDAAAEALGRLLPGRTAGRRQSVGCTVVYLYWTHWPCLLPQHGPGRKHEREIRLEPWQEAVVAAHPGDFLRGLFHSDGCRVINRVRRPLKDGDRWYAYPRYFFTNESRDILGLCGAGLDRLGIAWRFSRPNTISVARREAVAELDRYVGPKW